MRCVLDNTDRNKVDGSVDSMDLYEGHFGPSSSVISEAGRAAVDQKSWTSSREIVGRLGPAVISIPTSQGDSSDVLKKPDVRTS